MQCASGFSLKLTVYNYNLSNVILWTEILLFSIVLNLCLNKTCVCVMWLIFISSRTVFPLRFMIVPKMNRIDLQFYYYLKKQSEMCLLFLFLFLFICFYLLPFCIFLFLFIFCCALWFVVLFLYLYIFTVLLFHLHFNWTFFSRSNILLNEIYLLHLFWLCNWQDNDVFIVCKPT